MNVFEHSSVRKAALVFGALALGFCVSQMAVATYSPPAPGCNHCVGCGQAGGVDTNQTGICQSCCQPPV